jgi:hypothetical protein
MTAFEFAMTALEFAMTALEFAMTAFSVGDCVLLCAAVIAREARPKQSPTINVFLGRKMPVYFRPRAFVIL